MGRGTSGRLARTCEKENGSVRAAFIIQHVVSFWEGLGLHVQVNKVSR